MEEDIKILENLLEEGFEAMCYLEAQAIEHLIKGYRELEEKWDKDTHTLQNALDLANADKINNYIPVSLVEEKIEEINKAYEDSKDENGESEYYYPDYTIRVLQELLEKRK